jgi:hypothetical protein
MATSAQIRQQLVEALRSDLIGRGWDGLTRRHECLTQFPWIRCLYASPSPLPFQPDFLHKRIRDAIQAMPQAHQHLGGEQFLHHRLDLLHPHIPPDRFAVGQGRFR